MELLLYTYRNSWKIASGFCADLKVLKLAAGYLLGQFFQEDDRLQKFLLA